jgi:hypothetical protein
MAKILLVLLWPAGIAVITGPASRAVLGRPAAPVGPARARIRT